MDPREIDERLARTLDDRHLSRHERQSLRELMEGLGPDDSPLRSRAFAMARAKLASPEDGAILDWLEEVISAVGPRPAGKAGSVMAEAHFSPGDDCRRAIAGLVGRARRSIDVCVFTITDDRLADALIDAHRRGVALRVITDNEKAFDLGSDVERLGAAGITVHVDHSPFHMHHKFALFDGETLLTGSYNWTRGAAIENEENLIVTGDPRLTTAFAGAFERLWSRLGS